VDALAPGHVFAGKYRIVRKLGEGGMGAVYAAKNLDLGGLVALKVMLAEAESPEATARFDREARAASQLRGEHIVRTLDAGKLERGTPYIVLEYVEGINVEDYVTARGHLAAREAVEIIVQACEGVAEAHALGMVHRDLKLRNMLLTTRPNGTRLVKILDFGVVKLKEERTSTGVTLTHADAWLGSAHYMAPEQIQMSSKVDARADVWSLGVCLYRLLTGTRPFEGETVADVFSAIMGRHPKPLEEARPEIPLDLARAVERALEKTVRRRFQSVAELAAAIGPHASDAAAGRRIDAILRGGRPDEEARSTTAETLVLARPAESTAADDAPTQALAPTRLDVRRVAGPASPRSIPPVAPAVPAGPPMPVAPARQEAKRPSRAPVVVAAGITLTLAVGALVAWSGPRRGSPPSVPSSAVTSANEDAGPAPLPAVTAHAATSESPPPPPSAVHPASKPRHHTGPSPAPSRRAAGPFDRF
jgi:serine/threonine protein kinase